MKDPLDSIASLYIGAMLVALILGLLFGDLPHRFWPPHG